jgi:hypothetical protein
MVFGKSKAAHCITNKPFTPNFGSPFIFEKNEEEDNGF